MSNLVNLNSNLTRFSAPLDNKACSCEHGNVSYRYDNY